MSKEYDQEALEERLQAHVPGFGGYAECRRRSVSDEALRAHLGSCLRQVSGEVRRLQGRLSAAGQFKPATDLHRLGRRLQRTADGIARAACGYAGFFAAPPLAPVTLEGLYRLDLQLVAIAADLLAAATDLAQVATETRPERLATLARALDELDRGLDLRAEAAAAAGLSASE